MQSKPTQTMLYSFKADTPTVTAQRLKGLTTGTLPTFIDIGSNLNSSALTEDNIIHQFATHRGAKNSSLLYVVGDDTWKAVFPTGFDDYTMFDSFNTMDLHTVDNGIMHKLQNFNLSEGNSWNLFITHFLGVDHIGHTFNAFHPLMAERLKLMDSLLLRTIEQLPENTLLVFFGDHGMTDGGEHGGSTDEEIFSGLFLYSTRPLLLSQDQESSPQQQQEQRRRIFDRHQKTFQFMSTEEILFSPPEIFQIDFVPIFSFFADIPIPFSSLGMIPPELFQSIQSDSSPSSSNILQKMSTNANQIWRYLNHYFLNGKEFFSVSSDLIAKDSRELTEIREIIRNYSLPSTMTLDADLKELFQLYLKSIDLHVQYLMSPSIGSEERAIVGYFDFLSTTQQKMR
jgi:phosphatidylinositol glycan class O